jgi:alkylation response protein AidB-like acyl-CoA dehydrogenase
LLDAVKHPAADAVANELRTGGLVTIPLPRLAPVRGAWGWDLPFSELMAERDGVLRSVVEPVVFPCGARLLLAPATIAGERGLAVVPIDRRGVGASDEPALDLRYRVGRVDLAGVAIAPEDFITGGDLDGAIAAAGPRLSLFLDAEAVGASAELLERTVRYVSEREQFGRAIGSFQAVRHKVADMALLVENARALTARAAEAVETNPADALPEVWASRIYAGQAGKRVSELAIQCHGGMGFTWEQGLHVFYRAGLFARNFLSDRPSLYAALGGHLDIEGIRVDTA